MYTSIVTIALVVQFFSVSVLMKQLLRMYVYGQQLLLHKYIHILVYNKIHNNAKSNFIQRPATYSSSHQHHTLKEFYFIVSLFFLFSFFSVLCLVCSSSRHHHLYITTTILLLNPSFNLRKILTKKKAKLNLI